MLKIRIEQRNKLDSKFNDNLADKILVDAINNRLIKKDEKEESIKNIKHQIAKSLTYNLESEYQISIFVFASFFFGKDFDTDKDYPFHSILNQVEMSPNIKSQFIDKVCREAKYD